MPRCYANVNADRAPPFAIRPVQKVVPLPPAPAGALPQRQGDTFLSDSLSNENPQQVCCLGIMLKLGLCALNEALMGVNENKLC